MEIYFGKNIAGFIMFNNQGRHYESHGKIPGNLQRVSISNIMQPSVTIAKIVENPALIFARKV